MEYVNNIIKWCNVNEGFATILLSFGTLVVSILAIIISIRTARLPYKKKLLLNVGTYIGIGIDTIGTHITATNIGNRNIKIKNIGLLINKKCYSNIKRLKDSQITLSPGDATTQDFDKKELKELKELNKNYMVFGYVEDTEGTKYKKYVCRLNKLLKKYHI